MLPLLKYYGSQLLGESCLPQYHELVLLKDEECY